MSWRPGLTLMLATTACFDPPDPVSLPDGTSTSAVASDSAEDESIGTRTVGTDASATSDALDDSTSAFASTSSATTERTDTGSGQVVFRDGALKGEFGAGEFLGTVWVDDSVQVDGGPTGTFTSRVYDARSVASWSVLEWLPAAPYDRPLPPNQGTDQDYISGAVDMSDNIVLLRFDDEGPLFNGSMVPDASGRGNDAMVFAGPTGLLTGPGEFGQAAQDDMSTYLAMATSDDFDFGVSDFTWALWFRTMSACVGPTSEANQAYLGIEDDGADRAHMWLGCMRPSATACSGNGGSGFAGGVFRAVHSDDVGSICGTTNIVDGLWHHVALTKSGHPGGTLTLYVDGVAESQTQTTFAAPIDFEDGPDFAVGAFQDGAPQASATLDEVAIWRRALSGEEVGNLYQRGAFSLRLQVRACSAPDCANTVWAGPAGAGSWFLDDGPGPYAIGDLGSSQYIQYQLSMDGPGTPVSPAVYLVMITGQQ